MKAKNIFKKFKYVIIIAAAVVIGLLCLVACSKDSATEKSEEPVEKPQNEVVTGISVDTTNAKTVYELGGAPFDIAGVALVKHLEDGTQKPALVTEDMVVVPNMTTRGEKTVTVNYGGFSAEYKITVRELESYVLNTDGAKKSFELGDDFSSDGLALVASFYGVEQQETVKDGSYTVTAPDMTTAGIKTVTVSYCGIEKTYDIAVRKAPTLETATIVKVGGVVDIRIEGVLEGYAQANVSFDMQKLMSDVYVTEDLSLSTSFVPESGRFILTVQVDRAALEKMTDTKDVGYMLHMKVNGIPYDIVDVEEEVNAQVELNGTYYGLKGEQCFSDNESKFVILRVADSEDLLNPKSLAATSVKMEERDGKLGLVVSGDVTGLTLDGLEIRFVAINQNDSWTTVPLQTTVEIEGESFTAFAEIPDGNTTIIGSKVMFTRMIVPDFIDENIVGSDLELHDLPTVPTTEISFGAGKYTLEQKSIFDAKQLVTVTYSIESVEYAITSVTLEEEDGKLYYVIGGTFDGSSESWTPVVDMQKTYDDWASMEMPTAAGVEFGDGTFTVKQEITDFNADIDGKYISHLFVRGQSCDISDVSGFTDMSVNFEKDGTTYTYSIYAEQLFSNNESYFICFKVTAA